jgi:hypothetical protein
MAFKRGDLVEFSEDGMHAEGVAIGLCCDNRWSIRITRYLPNYSGLGHSDNSGIECLPDEWYWNAPESRMRLLQKERDKAEFSSLDESKDALVRRLLGL